MASNNQVLALYLDLADWYEQRGQAQMRDRFLVLAADTALSAGRPEEAERLRLRLLQHNPHHLLKPYTSLAEALKAPDVHSYVADLRRSYSADAARHLLESLRANAGLPKSSEAPIRPTALHLDPPEPAKEPAEVLKFYRVQEPGDEVPEPVAQRQVPVTRPLPKPLAPPPPVPRTPAAETHSPPPAPNRKPPRPMTVPAQIPPPRTPAMSPRPILSEKDEQDQVIGYWVCSALMVLLVLAGLALAAYTFARPFLPVEWFR